MNRTIVKQALKTAGFQGNIYFRKHNEFGTPDNFGPASHRRVLSQYDIEQIIDSVERDGFETVVVYLEPKSYYETVARLANPKHVWTEGEINGLRRNLGYCTRWSQTAAEELRKDIQCMNFPAFRITADQTKFGLDWLKRTQFKLNGELRAGAFIGEREAKIIKSFKRFEFIGLEFHSVNPYTGAPQCIKPLYRTVGRAGTFTYSVNPMGGFGGTYEVVGASRGPKHSTAIKKGIYNGRTK